MKWVKRAILATLFFAFSATAHAFPLPGAVVENGDTILNFKSAGLAPAAKELMREWASSDSSLLFISNGRYLFYIFSSPVKFTFGESTNYMLRITQAFSVRYVAFNCTDGSPSGFTSNPIQFKAGTNFGGLSILGGSLFKTTGFDPSGLPDEQRPEYTGNLILRDDGGIFGDGYPFLADTAPLHALTVNYLYADGTTAAPAHLAVLAPGATYTVTSPAIAGHTPDVPVVAGEMPGNDVTINVTYQKNAHTLTVEYQDEKGDLLLPNYTHQYGYGEAYSVASPPLAGYTPGRQAVAGTMPDADVQITVTYQLNKYWLSIYYRYEDGTEAAPAYLQEMAYGARYSIQSPIIEGYEADKGKVGGTIPVGDVVEYVTYHKLAPPPTEPPDASSPSSSPSSSEPMEPPDVSSSEGGQFKPPEGVEGEGSEQFKPPAGQEGEGSGQFKPPAGQEGDGSGQFRPPAGQEGEGSGQFKPPAGQDGEGGHLEPPQGVEGSGGGLFEPPSGTDNENKLFAPPQGQPGEGSGLFQPPSGGEGGGGSLFQPPSGENGGGGSLFEPPEGSDKGNPLFLPPSGTDRGGADKLFEPPPVTYDVAETLPFDVNYLYYAGSMVRRNLKPVATVALKIFMIAISILVPFRLLRGLMT